MLPLVYSLFAAVLGAGVLGSVAYLLVLTMAGLQPRPADAANLQGTLP